MKNINHKCTFRKFKLIKATIIIHLKSTYKENSNNKLKQ